ncbi:unnamed protein product [Amoebophrya sp. A25]|nr:unnamed protein product [Amoebophrya sp. A25]|eukprot:GSA25T00012439001.1
MLSTLTVFLLRRTTSMRTHLQRFVSAQAFAASTTSFFSTSTPLTVRMAAGAEHTGGATASPTDDAVQAQASVNLQGVEKEGEQLSLPAPGYGTTSEDHHAGTPEEEKKQVLEVNGERVTLDALGPIILNEDGSMARITNWHEMMEHEQKNTLRVIARRNAKRREALLKKMEEEKARQGSSPVESTEMNSGIKNEL